MARWEPSRAVGRIGIVEQEELGAPAQPGEFCTPCHLQSVSDLGHKCLYLSSPSVRPVSSFSPSGLSGLLKGEASWLGCSRHFGLQRDLLVALSPVLRARALVSECFPKAPA